MTKEQIVHNYIGAYRSQQSDKHNATVSFLNINRSIDRHFLFDVRNVIFSANVQVFTNAVSRYKIKLSPIHPVTVYIIQVGIIIRRPIQKYQFITSMCTSDILKYPWNKFEHAIRSQSRESRYVHCHCGVISHYRRCFSSGIGRQQHNIFCGSSAKNKSLDPSPTVGRMVCPLHTNRQSCRSRNHVVTPPCFLFRYQV